MSNHKVKGLLKGLRYISHIFENEKEPEMKIGYPTDVKHVAHIGWDGPSVNSPSWMTEFKSETDASSVPSDQARDGKEEEAPVKWVSEGLLQDGKCPNSSRRDLEAVNSPARELPEVPRSSRRQSSSGSTVGSPRREKSDKPRHRRSSKSSKDSTENSKSNRQPNDSINGGDILAAQNPPDIPKRTRRKKSKDSSVGGSVRSRPKAQAMTDTYQSPFSDPGSGSGSSMSKISELNQKQFEEEDETAFSRT